ncbi:LOW EXPRESSION OF OSMOTICALLY RESPONSIVE GENES 4 [Hibiscus trionum]|uniref:RNA helicase n=1 Tax=Hibiscus trionum TaxID=183268 RepID=A0A9W7I1L2_HIBTR|nr:LOW EXPRESSION OF OSMOTICALLY RESPONSIVE GENES 4 [Hibiscus trionum]
MSAIAAAVVEAPPPQGNKTATGASPTLEEKGVSEIDVGNLTINESRKTNKFLDEHEDSNIKPVTSVDTPYKSAFTFEELNLSPELLKGLYDEMKFEKPSEIQAICLPMILNPPYLDLIAQYHNGSGKSTCFVLGILSRIDPELKAPQALCICPTRELALQNLEVIRKMAKYTGITSECAIPMTSTNYIPNHKLPPITAQVVIGTPGTARNRIVSKKLDVSYVKILVLDEAGPMFEEEGFKDDSLRLKKSIASVSSHCQVLLFSATFTEPVKKFMSKIVKKDHNQLFFKKEELFVEKEEQPLDSMKQYKVKAPDELSKIMVIKDRILELGEHLGPTVIFVRTRNSATMLHNSLVDFGYDVTTFQGALEQEDRDKIVKDFNDGLTQVLISTDLLDRGFDQQQIKLVINYDLPVKHDHITQPDFETYMHRICRAGRSGGKGGAVFNLLCGFMDEMIMSEIEKYFGIEVAEVPDWSNDEHFKTALRSAGLYNKLVNF